MPPTDEGDTDSGIIRDVDHLGQGDNAMMKSKGKKVRPTNKEVNRGVSGLDFVLITDTVLDLVDLREEIHSRMG